ncbi:MAG: hypothetical protein HYX78_08055 [Armatimonadetes bacterium]|nr:hypothetical protein [Armatimonadota bacterium]
MAGHYGESGHPGGADHYGFEPKVAPAYSPWVKGKVERPMDFIRERFWRGYCFVDIETANRDLLAFLEEQSHRIHGTTGKKVCEMFESEKEFLMPLPPGPCDVSLRLYRKVHDNLTKLRLPRTKEILPETLRTAEVEGWGYLTLLNRLLDEEVVREEQRWTVRPGAQARTDGRTNGLVWLWWTR